MWNFFKRESKRVVKKKTAKKSYSKPASKKPQASNPLDILDRTMEKKLKEMQEHKTQLVDQEKEVHLKKNVQSVDKKTYINKPADINFTQKQKKTHDSAGLTTTSNIKGNVQIEQSFFIQALDNTIQDIDSGILFAGLTDIKTKQILKQTSNQIYDISMLNSFIKQFLEITKNEGTNNPYLLIDLDKNVFLYLQIFELHYFTILLDKNELSLGHVLNIIKPRLIQNYHKALNKLN